MSRKVENMIICAQKLAELGLQATYARQEILRQEGRLETEDPRILALEIFEAAEDEWKTPADDTTDARRKAAEQSERTLTYTL